MTTTKHSKQRDAILEVVKKTKTHPSADWVYSKVRETIPNISLGTVYRNLSKLAEDNLIQKLAIGLSSEHFDGTVDSHYHVVCKKCGKITDIEGESLASINKWAADKFDGDIYEHSMVFFGKCKTCKDLEKNIL